MKTLKNMITVLIIASITSTGLTGCQPIPAINDGASLVGRTVQIVQQTVSLVDQANQFSSRYISAPPRFHFGR